MTEPVAEPRTEPIGRPGRGTSSGHGDSGVAVWHDIEEMLRAGTGTSWLSVRGRHGGVHTRPVFAAWGGSSFLLATKAEAAKTAHLRADSAVSLAVHLGTVHLVVEGAAARVTSAADLTRASVALRDVYDWPTEVVGDELDAPYAAPTSGGPPFQAWEIRPARAFAFPTDDQCEPTRFVFD